MQHSTKNEHVFSWPRASKWAMATLPALHPNQRLQLRHSRQLCLFAIEPMARPRTTKPPTERLESGRLNRYIARAGVCSRRKADHLIENGQVKVNGLKVYEFWHKVDKGDEVRVNGKIISPREFLYVLLNKPKDTITTSKDERGRKTVLDQVKND
ncbi:MAG: hypothetical protein F4246_11010, partial [Rhodothermaceae bacterium]|nr:hypothetical protein [Rhodothermaceae bacterium]